MRKWEPRQQILTVKKEDVYKRQVQQIAQVTNMMQSAAAASERVFEFLEEEEEEQTVEHPVTLENRCV